MLGSTQVEGQEGEDEEDQGEDQEDPLEDIGVQDNEHVDCGCTHAQRGEEDQEVKDHETQKDALVTLLGVYFEHILSFVHFGFDNLFSDSFLHFNLIIKNYPNHI